MILDAKKEINQPGRLLDHLQNELKLTGRSNGNSQVKELIAEALEDLVTSGIVIVEKRGKVYDSVKRTQRKRAKSVAAAPAPKPAPPTPKRPTPPAVAQEEIMSHPPVPPVIEEGILSHPPAESIPPAAPTRSELTPVEMIEQLVGKIEQYKLELENERLAHAETSRQKAGILQAKLEFERELRKATSDLEAREAELERERETVTQLKSEAATANVSLRSGIQAVEQLRSRVSSLEEERDRLASQLREQETKDPMEELAKRVARAMS